MIDLSKATDAQLYMLAEVLAYIDGSYYFETMYKRELRGFYFALEATIAERDLEV